jgi:predicted O-methyltransferase YrrM
MYPFGSTGLMIPRCPGIDKRIFEVLARLEEQSRKEKSGEVKVKHKDAMLAISFDTGIFFNILLKASKAKRILEVGTSTGYSTLWFADAVMSMGQRQNSRRLQDRKFITTIESNRSKVRRAEKNFSDAGVDSIVQIIQGQARSVLHSISKDLETGKSGDLFDFVFLDADKENLPIYFNLVLSLVKPGGIISTDNMLYPEELRPQMQIFAKHIRKLPNVQSVTVPIGNGEEISMKLVE